MRAKNRKPAAYAVHRFNRAVLVFERYIPFGLGSSIVLCLPALRPSQWSRPGQSQKCSLDDLKGYTAFLKRNVLLKGKLRITPGAWGYRPIPSPDRFEDRFCPVSSFITPATIAFIEVSPRRV
jgi:hypothetical protein